LDILLKFYIGENMSELKRFKLINKIEGISFLILLFVAMPMKYMMGIPMATKIVGMIHGLLVLAFIYQIFEAKKEAALSWKEMGKYTLLSLVPFGSFYTDKELARKITVA